MSVGTDYGKQTSTVYQREQSEKDAINSGKVTHNDFLKLLTKQLTTQDPLNPMQDIDFTGQLAQLQALDEQVAMTKTMQNMRVDTQLQAGTAMIGKYISGTDSAGAPANGLVSRVVQNSDGVFVELSNKQKVEIGSVNNVWNDASGMMNDMANSSNVIGMWVECGYDEAAQPIKGIVQSVQMVDGQVQLQLYGGQTVTWNQVQSMRGPTEEEIFLYTFPDEVREKVQAARGMIYSAVTGKDKDGNEVSGIVEDAKLVGSDVYLVLYGGDLVKLDDVEGEARKPTAEDAAKSLGGYYVTGLVADGTEVSGIVVGAEDNEDGMALILDGGERVYWDAVYPSEIRAAKNEDGARLHGKWVKGKDVGGEEVEGIVVKKVEVDGHLAVELDTGKVVLCPNIESHRDATEEEKNRLG